MSMTLDEARKVRRGQLARAVLVESLEAIVDLEREYAGLMLTAKNSEERELIAAEYMGFQRLIQKFRTLKADLETIAKEQERKNANPKSRRKG